MTNSITNIMLKVYDNINIACTLRVPKKLEKQTIIFIHGFGSSKSFFKHAFKDNSLKQFNLLTLDLPCFGKSEVNSTFSYSMSEYGQIVLKVLDELNFHTFHLCAHSMGGLIGIEIAEQAPQRTLSFSNLEGNLTIEDCFMSGLILKYSFQEFEEYGRCNFEMDLEEKAKRDSVLFPYLKTFKQSTTEALYKCAQHTIKESTDSAALQRFLKLNRQCYIYGEKNKSKYPGEKVLLEQGIPVFYIADSGHSMTEENPNQTYSIISQWIYLNNK